MPAQFQFELVSPEKMVLSKSAVMVTVPGGEGDFGVLAGHAPVITAVRPGVIEVYAENDNTITDRVFVAGGFAEVTDKRCTVLAERAQDVASLDRVKLEDEARNLAGDEEKLAIVKAKLAALQQ